MAWKSSQPHESRDQRIGRHIDVEKYDERDRKDKSAGKMKIDKDENKPEVRDIKPPSK
jgi:hypothetical protein